MKLKNNRGITLVTLVITIIVLIILVSATTYIGVDLASTAEFENMETNLLLIQSQCKILSEKVAIEEIEESELYGTYQDDGTYAGWYKLSESDLYEMGLENLNANDGYYVNYDEVDVAYEIGIEYEDVTYYTLSSMLETQNKQ